MTGTIVYLVFSFLISMIFVILGISQCRSKTPVTINTGLTPPKEEELTSVSEWNKRHGRDFIILGCALFITLSLFVFFLEKTDNIGLQALIFVAAGVAEIAWVVIDHKLMEKKMIKKGVDSDAT